jgi:hypothetical protein
LSLRDGTDHYHGAQTRWWGQSHGARAPWGSPRPRPSFGTSTPQLNVHMHTAWADAQCARARNPSARCWGRCTPRAAMEQPSRGEWSSPAEKVTTRPIGLPIKFSLPSSPAFPSGLPSRRAAVREHRHGCPPDGPRKQHTCAARPRAGRGLRRVIWRQRRQSKPEAAAAAAVAAAVAGASMLQQQHPRTGGGRPAARHVRPVALHAYAGPHAVSAPSPASAPAPTASTSAPGPDDHVRDHPTLELMRRRLAEGSRPGARAAHDTARLGVAVEGGGMRGIVSGAMLIRLREYGLQVSGPGPWGFWGPGLGGLDGPAGVAGMVRLGWPH